MAHEMKGYVVLLAASDGLEKEREAFRQALVEYNESEALDRGVFFAPVGWHPPLKGVASTGTDVAAEIPRSHYFILLLWDRWEVSSSGPAAGSSVYEAASLYKLASACVDDPSAPMRQIVVLFKGLNERQLSDPGPLMGNLLSFKRGLEAARGSRVHTFDEISGFERLVRRYLANWVIDHEEGSAVNVVTDLRQIKLGSSHARWAFADMPDYPADSDTTEKAECLLKDGSITEAEIAVAQAAVTGNDLHAMNRYGVFLVGEGRSAHAQTVFERIEELTRQSERESWQASALNNLAEVYRRRGRHDEAERRFKAALALCEKIYGLEHLEVGRVLRNLAELLRAQGHYKPAEPLCRRALAIQEKALGAKHPQTIQSMNYLAEIHHTLGNFAMAESMYERSLSIAENEPGADSLQVALCLNNLALLYDDEGKYKKAEPFYKRSLQIRETLLGPAHPDVAGTLNNLAALYRSRGLDNEAESLQRRSLQIWERGLGPDHPDVATGLSNLAALCFKQGRYVEAERLHRRALRIRDRALGPEHPDVATSLHNLAEVYRAQDRYDEAGPLLRRTIVVWEKTLGANHPNLAASLNKLAGIYHAQNKHQEAEDSYSRSLAIMERAFGSSHPDVPAIMENYAALLRTVDRRTEAARLESKAQALRSRLASENAGGGREARE